MGLLFSFLLIPTLAVVLQGYTGLVYTLEILLGLVTAMWLVTQEQFRDIIDTFLASDQEKVQAVEISLEKTESIPVG